MKILTFLFLGFNPVEIVLGSFFLYFNLKQKRICNPLEKSSSDSTDFTENEIIFASQGLNKPKGNRLYIYKAVNSIKAGTNIIAGIYL